MTDNFITNPLTGIKRQIPEGVTLRLGRPEDLPSITKLTIDGEILLGWDYLPAVWLEHVSDPKRIMAVAVKDNQVVAFTASKKANNGRSVIAYGARAHPADREKGIYAALMAYKVQLVLESFPTAQQSIAVTANFERVVGLIHKEKPKRFPVSLLKYIFLAHDESRHNVEAAYQAIFVKRECKLREMARITKIEDLADILSNPRQCMELFAGAYFSLFYEGFEANETAAEDVFIEDRHILVDRDNGQVLSISFGTTYKCIIGTAYNIECFGRLDTTLIMSHVKAHFPFIFKSHEAKGGNIVIYLSIPHYCEIEPIERIFRDEQGLSDGKVGQRKVCTLVIPFPQPKM